MLVSDIIRKVGSKYRLYSRKGKNLGTFASRAAAEKHERRVQYFKRRKHDCTCDHHQMFDATSRRLDPTGTGDIRSRMNSDLGRRWAQLRIAVREALIQHNILGLGPPTAVTIVRTMGVDPVKLFQTFIDEALGRIVLGADGEWIAPYLHEAASRGRARAARQAGWMGAPPRARTDRVVISGAITELQGVMEAVSQRAVRAIASGILANDNVRKIASEISIAITKVGLVRGRALVNFSVIRAYNSAALDAFEDLGVRLVDIDPEFQRNKIITRDALVEVLTAGDDLVCEVCEEISQDGPYEISEARGLIPAHPNCRCAFVPWEDERFAEIERE